MSVKPCLNLCWRRWLKPNRNHVYDFIPTESLISKVSLLAGPINFNDVLRNELYEVELLNSRPKFIPFIDVTSNESILEKFRYARSNI